ncbi:MAG: response regulator transcription factor [Pseudomonadales bacterium]|nr:response regulator transcription factor [Pseudomonadales bacterium]
MSQLQDCLITEDHPQARAWLEKAVKQAFPEASVRTADSVKGALAELRQALPDLALVDLGLLDGSGQDVIRALEAARRQAGAEITIVVSTVMNDDESIFTAIRSGADGYILKEETLDTLVAMLQGIRQNKPPLSASIALRLLNFFRAEEGDDPLAPRERQVLQLLAKGFTVPRVAEMLGITYNTASSYVRDIYRKLNVTSRAEATLEASKRGLV